MCLNLFYEIETNQGVGPVVDDAGDQGLDVAELGVDTENLKIILKIIFENNLVQIL